MAFAAVFNISTLYGILSVVKSTIFPFLVLCKFLLSLLLSFIFIAAILFVNFSKVVVFSSFNFSDESLVDVNFSLLCTSGLETTSFTSLLSSLSSVRVLPLLIFSCVDF